MVYKRYFHHPEFTNNDTGYNFRRTTNQNGMKTKTTVKEIKFETVPASVFSTPKGYSTLTPQQLREMPVGN